MVKKKTIAATTQMGQRNVTRAGNSCGMVQKGIGRVVSQKLLHRPRITIRAADPGALTAAVRAVVSEVLPVHDAVSLTPAAQVLRDALLPQRLGAILVGGVGFAALLLAGVGLYGLVQFHDC